MGRVQVPHIQQSLIAGYLFILIITGCSSEYSTVGPALEGTSSISGGAMLLLAGMPGGIGTSDGTDSVARFNSPRGIAVYGDTLYIADQNNHSIRKIDIPAKTVTTIAGYSGVPGLDDGVGSAARFNAPEGIETDGAFLYISDTKNSAIRKIDMGTGSVVTLAGKRGQKGSKDGAGSDSLFSGPTAIALLGEFLYVTDTDNHTIRRVHKDTGDTVTVAGTPNKKGSQDGIGGDALFNFPLGIARAGASIYISDTFNHTIRRLDPLTGEVMTLAGISGQAAYQDGSLIEARFYYPYGLSVRGTELFVADLWNEVIRVVDLSAGMVSTVAGTEPVYGAASELRTFPGYTDGAIGVGRFYSPADIAVSGDYLYVTDMNNQLIRRVDILTGEISKMAGKPVTSGTRDATATESRFSTPGGITMEGEALFVADTFNHTIRKIDMSTGEVSTLAGFPGVYGSADSTESPALFNSPTDVIVDAAGENLYIVDTDNHVIRRMRLSTGEVRTFAGYPGIPGALDGTGWDARFNSPKRGVRVGDKLYITDTGNHIIRQVDMVTGVVTTVAGESAVSGWTDTGEGSGSARFNSPGDMTTDGTFLYVADTGNHAIRKVDPLSGVVVTMAGIRGSSGLVDSTENGAAPLFNSPEGIVWHNGILYVADTGNHLIRKIDIATGDVSFLAGDISCIEETEMVNGVSTTKTTCTAQSAGLSSYGDSTDGTGKTTAFNSPTGMNTDGTYLYVMDTGISAIRRVDMSTGETKTFSYSQNKGISLSSPSGGDIAEGLLYIADKNNHIVRKLDIAELSRAPLILIAGSVGESGYRYSAGYSAQFNRPVGITADGMGNLYVADTGNHTIRKVVIATKEVTTIAGIPGRSGFMNSEFGFPRFTYPRGICIVGDHLYVADSGNHLIRRVNVATGYVGLVAGLVDYVTNEGSSGTVDSTGAAAGFNDPRGITSDGTYLYVTDTGNHTIRRVLRTTGQVKTIAGMPEEAGYRDGVDFEARFRYPRGITADGEYLYVADAGNNVLRRVNKHTGEVLTFSGKTGQSSFASGTREEARYNNVVSIATSPDTPYLFFTDSIENAVGRVEK